MKGFTHLKNMVKRHGIVIDNNQITSSPDLNVIGVFNPGVAFYHDKYYMLVRVAETGTQNNNSISIPIYVNGSINVRKFDKSDQHFDFSDSRVIKYSEGQFLTSMSRLVLCTSVDGKHFDIHNVADVVPSDKYESFGIEDPRLVVIDDDIFLTYVAVSDKGIVTKLLKTNDFINYENYGIIMHPDNKDVVLFPRKIDEKYYLLHRPSTSAMGKPEIWLASSPDLKHYGDHKHVLSCGDSNGFDGMRIGPSSQPIELKEGWLLIYHGCDKDTVYSLGAVLLDLNDPSKVLKRTKKPFVVPTAEYEKNGFVPNVIFSCNAVLKENVVQIYYGACDTYTCLLEIGLADLLGLLED